MRLMNGESRQFKVSKYVPEVRSILKIAKYQPSFLVENNLLCEFAAYSVRYGRYGAMNINAGISTCAYIHTFTYKRVFTTIQNGYMLIILQKDDKFENKQKRGIKPDIFV